MVVISFNLICNGVLLSFFLLRVVINLFYWVFMLIVVIIILYDLFWILVFDRRNGLLVVIIIGLFFLVKFDLLISIEKFEIKSLLVGI